MPYQVLTDHYISQLFKGTDFGEPINQFVNLKRLLIKDQLRNQIDGYWSDRTIYQIMINGGFLRDAKSGAKKELTALGVAFLKS